VRKSAAVAVRRNSGQGDSAAGRPFCPLAMVWWVASMAGNERLSPI